MYFGENVNAKCNIIPDDDVGEVVVDESMLEIVEHSSEDVAAGPRNQEGLAGGTGLIVDDQLNVTQENRGRSLRKRKK